MTALPNLRIDAERLWGELMETAAIGGTPKGGICRLTLTDLDRQVRDWFKARAEKLGCTRHGRRHGRDVRAPRRARPTCRRSRSAAISTPSRPAASSTACSACSAALEALRTLVEAGYETYAPIEVVNWTNEEGSRFAPAMVSSGVFAGAFEQRLGAVAHGSRRRDLRRGARRDRLSRRRSAAASIRCRRSSSCTSSRGRSSKPRARTSASSPACRAMRWYEVTITGQDAHTGATPMHLRKNALLGAARLVERGRRDRAQRIAPRRSPPSGVIEVRPNSPNVVPGEVFFTVDLRHPDGAALDAMEADVRAALPRGLRRRSASTFAEQRDLGPAARCASTPTASPRCARAARAVRLFGARHRLRRRPRRRLRVAGRADRDDLRAVPRRHQPQRGGVLLQGAVRHRRAGAAAGGAGLRPAAAGASGTPRLGSKQQTLHHNGGRHAQTLRHRRLIRDYTRRHRNGGVRADAREEELQLQRMDQGPLLRGRHRDRAGQDHLPRRRRRRGRERQGRRHPAQGRLRRRSATTPTTRSSGCSTSTARRSPTSSRWSPT